jgi:hypothetical protein
LSELIPLSKFPGVIEAQLYIVRAHTSGLVSRPMQVVDPNALLYVSLGVRGYDIYSAYPLRGFVDVEKSQTLWIANLGLLGKMSGAAAVLDTKITKHEGGRIFIDTNIKALGVLGSFPIVSYKWDTLLIYTGIYISDLPKRSFIDSLLITILGEVIPVHTVSISKADSHVLEIDIERAWKELNLESKWSNEVGVKIYISPL